MPLRHAEAVSAGGVVYRVAGDQPEILICGEYDRGIWALPKGTPDPGEDLLQTALREVEEETGIRPAVDEPLGAIEYWYVEATERTRYHKVVHFWLMRAVGGSLDRHDHEWDEVRWVPLEEAPERLRYPTEREVVQRARAALERQADHG